MRKSAHWGDALDGCIGLGRSIRLVGSQTNPVDLLVDLSPVMVAVCEFVSVT